MPRIHRLTKVVCLLVAVPLVLIAVPGEEVWELEYYGNIGGMGPLPDDPRSVTYRHGWPWPCLWRTSVARFDDQGNWWTSSAWASKTIGHHFNVAPCLLSIGANCLILAWAGTAIESFLRWRNAHWRINLRLLFVAIALFAIALATVVDLHRKSKLAKAKLSDTETVFGVYPTLQPTWLSRLAGYRASSVLGQLDLWTFTRIDWNVEPPPDVNFEDLHEFRDLTEFDVGTVKITESDVPFIVKLRNLEQLDLRRTTPSARMLSQLRSLPNLWRLAFRKTDLSKEHIHALADLPALLQLEVSYDSTSWESILQLKKRLPHLRIRDVGVYPDFDVPNYRVLPFSKLDEPEVLETVESLINDDCDYSNWDKFGRSLVSAGTASDFTSVVQLLLERGKSTDARDRLGRMPIHIAAMHGSLRTVLMLLRYDDSGVDQPDDMNRWPIDYAAQQDDLAIVDLLFERTHPQASTWVESALHAVIFIMGTDPDCDRRAGLRIINHLIAAGEEPYSIEQMGSQFDLAVALALLDVVACLIDTRYDDVSSDYLFHLLANDPYCSVNQSDEDRCSIAKLLIERGFIPNLENEDGYLPEELARLHGFPRLAKVLKEARNNPPVPSPPLDPDDPFAAPVIDADDPFGP